MAGEPKQPFKPGDAVNHPTLDGRPYEAKACSACECPKPLADFPPDLRRKDRRGSKCRICVTAARTAFYSKYPEKEAQRRLKNLESGSRWYSRNRERLIRRFKRNRLIREYGITELEYAAMLEAQGGVCAICGADDPGRGDCHFAIDHCHATGAVRGLLCQRCNTGIGFFRDAPDLMRRAATYVESEGKRPNSSKALHVVVASAY